MLTHPHLHLLVSAGGIAADGRWVALWAAAKKHWNVRVEPPYQQGMALVLYQDTTGSSWTSRFRPVSESWNFFVADRVDEPVARIFRCGKASAPIFSSRLGSGS